MSDLTVTLVQSNLHWENAEANLRMFDEKLSSIKEKTEVIVLPEMFSTGFTMNAEQLAEPMDGPSVSWMTWKSKEMNAVITGSLIIRDNGHCYNRLIWAIPDGSKGIYDKRHLFGLGEEDQHFAAGNKRLIASVKGWKLCLNVCYDLRFPAWSRNQNSSPYDILIFVANWPKKRNLAWNTLLQARAIENQCYVIGVNRVGEDGNKVYHEGDSSLIGPLGEILYKKNEKEDIFTISLSEAYLKTTREQYPFLKDSDRFLIL